MNDSAISMKRAVRIGVLLLAGLATIISPDAKAANALFVGNDQPTGGVLAFPLPIFPGEAPSFNVPVASVTGVGVDASGNMLVGDLGHVLHYFPAPVSGASTATATFNNGAAAGAHQIAFSATGDVWVGAANAAVNRFSPPFTNASVPVQTIVPPGATSAIGVVLDVAQNLYISDSNKIFVYAPPYAGPPIVTPALANTAYRKMAILGSQLFVCQVNGTTFPQGDVDVYNLPLTAASTPAFQITNGVNLPEGVASDGTNMYVGNLGAGNVTMYASPFSAGSAAVTTLTMPSSTSIFSIAIGPSTLPPSASIPALGYFGLIALCAVLLFVGLIAIRPLS